MLAGLSQKSGEPLEIIIGQPTHADGTYSCSISIPGVVSRSIYGENCLSTLISALRFVEDQIHTPSVAIKSITDLTDEDYPDLQIDFR